METKDILVRIMKIGIILTFLTPLVLGPFGLNFSEYPKAVFFRTIVEIILVFYIWLILLNPDYVPKKSALLYSVIIFYAILIVASIVGINFSRSFFGDMQRGEGLILHLHLLAFFIILMGSFRKKEDWLLFFKSTVIISALSSIAAVLQKLQVFSFYGIEYGYRPSGTLSNPDLFATYITLSIFLTIFLLISEKKKYLKVVWLFLIVLNFYTLILSGTRSAWVGFGFGIISIYLLNYRNLNYKKRIYSLIIVLLISFLILFAPTIIEKFHLENNSFAGRILSMYNINAGFRLGLSEIAFRAFEDRPFLGWGFESYSFVSDKYFTSGYSNTVYFDRPHDKLAEVLTYGGALGIISYFSIFFILFYIILKNAKKDGKNNDKSRTLFASILFAFFVCYFFQNIFSFDNIGTYILFFLLASFVSNNFSGLAGVEFKKINKPMTAVRIILIIDSIIFLAFVLYQVNIKPTVAAMNFPYYVKFESMDPLKAVSGYKKGIDMNTVYYNDMLVAGTDRAIFLLENGFGRSVEGNIIDILLEMKPALSKAIKEKDMRPINLHDFLSRIDEWSYIVRQDPAFLDQMQEDIKQAIAFNPNIPVFYQLRGEMEILQSKNDEGENDIKKSCKLDLVVCNNNEAEADKMIGIAYYKRGDLTDALKNFQKALEVDYNSRKNGLPYVISGGGQFTDTVALIYYTYLKDFEDCKKVYERGMEVYPDYKNVLEQHLNMITADYEKNKQK